MDIRIAGSGNIPSGSYKEITIAGSGRLAERVQCIQFSVSGSGRGENIECAESFKVSGGAKFMGDIEAKNVRITGSLVCGGNVSVEETLSCFGSAKCERDVKCEKLSVTGALHVDGNVEAESVNVDGSLHCAGLLNAEKIDIKADHKVHIGSIGGSKIVIYCETKEVKRLPLFSSLVSRATGSVTVVSSVEGDDVAIERVTCPRVTGRVVAVGAGCQIDLVQYSECVEISPDAMVGKTEKI